MSNLLVVSYRPALQGLLASRFYRAVSAAIMNGTANDAMPFGRLAESEAAWATTYSQFNPVQRAKYRAAWLLLRDLQRIGWVLSWRRNTVYLTQPEQAVAHLDVTDIMNQKQLIRNAMSYARASKIAQHSDFIERMHRQPTKGQAKMPISALIADGAALARDLRKVARISDLRQRAETLKTCVRPYIQLVDEKTRCTYTGHLLSEIWRYFRFTWSSPPESTPGRTLLYLVRDGARPNHPVMGIFSLENSPILIRCRDHELGWTVDAFVELLANMDRGGQRKQLETYLSFVDNAMADVNTKGLCSKRDVTSPSETIISKLVEVARRADEERGKEVHKWHSRDRAEGDRSRNQSDLGNISKGAENALYQRKRAEKLVRLMTAKRYLQRLLLSDDPARYARDGLSRESEVSALRDLLVTVKSHHIGTSILELNVCGAIRPYNSLLAGKLCALLALSPTVVRDYRKRYGDRPSDIASRIKGEPVVRAADLLYVGTSSLYVVGSSQYNRLRLPAQLFPGASRDVIWARLGETQGFGTLHIGRDTVTALDELLTLIGNRRANHVFGEGASPKFRKIRAGIEETLEAGVRDSVDAVARHEMRRIVYGAWLTENGREMTSGGSGKPKFYFSNIPPEEGTGRIIDFWIERWLAMRLNHKESLVAVASFSAQQLLVRVDQEAIGKESSVEDELIPAKGGD